MLNDTPRKMFTVVLTFGAVVFGMVLAGGTDLTPLSIAEPLPAPDGGVHVETVATGGLPSFADLAEAVAPAVVSIRATKIENAAQRRNDPFEFFFNPRRDPRNPGQEGEQRSDSSGSGFVISPEGYVVTNHHVIEDATDLTVILDGREYPATVQGDDPATDIALLKIEADEELTYLNLGDSESLRPGDWVMVIGSPLQLQNSVSVGVVSAKARRINITPDASLESFIQTDAAINFGNSGGPVVDLNGSVVGIATAINFGAENIGFAVPVSTLQGILPQLRDDGAVRRGYLGVNIQNLTEDRARAFGRDSTDGALVTLVMEEGPADEAGIRHGDIILQVGDHEVTETRDLIDYVSLVRPGTDLDIELYRDGKRVKRKVTLGERPSQGEVIARVEPEEDDEMEWLGIQFQDLTGAIRESHGMPEEMAGVFVTNVAPSSPLWEEGLRSGDIVTEVNGEKVDSVKSFENVVGGVESGAMLRLYYLRFDPRSQEVIGGFFAFVKVP